jgi:hypothetical protein
MPRPIPIYNADGTLNKDGTIKEYVEIRMIIQDHVERIQFAVSNIGESDVFIGHEWLKKHNPEVDWRKSALFFTQCPDECGHITTLDELDGDPVEKQTRVHLEDGDRLFAFDIEGYMLNRTFMGNAQEEEDIFKKVVPPHYHDYKDIFDKKDFDQLPDRQVWDHAIELMKDFKPVDCKVYPLNPTEQKALEEFIEENLSSRRIRPSKSPMASPFFFVKKADRKLRLTQDYQKLNEATIKNRYPLPLIGELIDKLKGAKHFTKLDVQWGYNNVQIKEGDEWKAAFRTNIGLFEPTVMFFGLMNSPATFQAMMNHLFHDLIMEGKVVIYLDNILIFSKDLNEHRKITRRVLQILRENKLSLKPEKCEFEKTETKYLGMIIGNGQIRMDPTKVQAISE